MFAAAHEPGYGTSRNSGNDRLRAAIKVFADINSFKVFADINSLDLSGRTYEYKTLQLSIEGAI
jgi:hypothetical protein